MCFSCIVWQNWCFWTFSQVTVSRIYTAMSEATSVLTSQEMTKRKHCLFSFFWCCQEWQLILFQSRSSQNKLLFIRRFLSPVTCFLFAWPSGWRPWVLAARSPFHCAVTQHIPLVWGIGHRPTVRGFYSVSHSCVGGEKKKMLTCSHSLDVATLIMRGINIPTSAGLIRLSFHTKTDCS